MINYNYFHRCFASILIVWITLSGVHCVEYYTEKPSYISSCKIYQPGFTKCSTASIQKLMTHLSSIGIPEIQESFGPLEPMKLDKIVYKQDNNEVATIRANLTDLIITGFSNVLINESRVSKKDFSWETKIFMPKFRIEGKYKMAGRILLIPLSGAGDMFIDIENLDILMHSKTRLYEKGGFTFYNVTKVRVDLSMSGLKTNFANLFNGNSKDVELSTNEFFNENWRDFFEALRPVVNETVENVLLSLLQKIFHLIPANFFVEDIPTPEKLYGKAN